MVLISGSYIEACQRCPSLKSENIYISVRYWAHFAIMSVNFMSHITVWIFRLRSHQQPIMSLIWSCYISNTMLRPWKTLCLQHGGIRGIDYKRKNWKKMDFAELAFLTLTKLWTTPPPSSPKMESSRICRNCPYFLDFKEITWNLQNLGPNFRHCSKTCRFFENCRICQNVTELALFISRTFQGLHHANRIINST